jgi:hypothetical protein
MKHLGVPGNLTPKLLWLKLAEHEKIFHLVFLSGKMQAVHPSPFWSDFVLVYSFAMDSKKPIHSPSNVDHQEDVEKHRGHHNADVAHGFSTNQDTLPKGYYRSFKFIGTMLATGLGLASAVGGFGLAAPALGLINSEIGPDPNIIWVSLVYTLTLAIGLILVGRLSDLFGRRVSHTVCILNQRKALTYISGSSSARQHLH